MSEGSAGLYVTVDSEDGRQLGAPFTHRVQAKVGTVAGQYLTVMVLDTGQWVLTEVDLAGSPRIIARGQLPGSRHNEEWHQRIGH
jgi:hypothetical protein